MVIRNRSETYLVIRELAHTDKVRQYLCRGSDGRGGERFYRAALQEVFGVSGDQIRFLMDQAKNESFTDFAGFFTDGDQLAVLMAAAAGTSLAAKLQEEEVSLEEKLEIGKNLLERLLLLKLPPFFLEAAMDSRLIQVDKADQVALDYDLSRLDQCCDTEFSQGCRKLGQVFSRLFQEELSLRAIPELETLVYGLEHGEQSELIEVFQAFLPIYRTFRERKREELEPRNFWFRLWEWVKGIGRFLKWLIKPALLLLAVAYLALTVRDFLAAPGVKETFSQIGTLRVEEHPGETEETGAE